MRELGVVDGHGPPIASVAESTLSLLERAKAGDALAADQLFARFVPALRRWASGRLPRSARDITDTVDLVQDAVLQTLRRLDKLALTHEGALQAYLRTAILNRIRDELRRAGRRSSNEPVQENDPASSDASPLDEAIGRQSVERYESALARLDPIEREAIIARLELGYSYDQVAEAVGRPSAEAARAALRRALIHLAQEMNDAE